MFPVIALMLLLIGCDVKKIVDESRYAESTTEDMLTRAETYIAEGNDKEALLQLSALNVHSLTLQQQRWVRDQMVTVYYNTRDFKDMITYLDARAHLKSVTPDEAAMNLFDKAEAYHRLSYNYWARVIGMGSPYRRSRDAMQAQKYYKEFLEKYPHNPKAPYVKQELELVDAYIVHYYAELQKHRDFRKNIKKSTTDMTNTTQPA